jgi:glucan phosphoethanolaminetransferase (alkaline phosphatase superfamily)
MVQDKPLPYFLWFLLPLGWMVIQLAMEIGLDDAALDHIHSENGPHELLQFFAAAAAFIVSCLTLRAMDRSNKWLVAWVGIAALGTFYIAGEEISWGQQFLHWTTPEYWDAINDQQETNLHNTSSWLDQKPRWLVQMGMFVGGLIIPFLQRVKPSLLPDRFRIIYPPATLAVTAGIAALVKLSQMLGRELFDVTLFFRSSEVGELYMFYFLMLYMMVMRNRLKRA